jgi:peptidoglycan/LPS O-acetylase OafA/YrhL
MKSVSIECARQLECIMTPFSAQPNIVAACKPENSRLDYLDATRAFALVLGVVFHASLSFVPIFMGWAVQDVSTSPLVAMFMTVSHSFRMETFFLLAGFFSHLAFHRKGAGEFVYSRMLRIVVPFVVGWFALRPLVVSGWIMGSASLRGNVDVWAGLLGGFQSLSTLPAGIFTGTHLWFLYYLVIITTLALTMRGLVRATAVWRVKMVQKADALVAWLASSRISVLLLAVPTAATLWFMGSWGMDTPDRSLRPHLPALGIYGGFFILGWMLNRQRELISRFARLAPERWIFAALGVSAMLLLGDIERDPVHPHYIAAHVAYALSYALMMWSLVFLSLGIFGRLCSRPNPFVRFVADSSYWMYLIHLPVVVWLQVAVATVPLHWSLKLAFISVVTVVISLVTYDLFVRATFIGWVLNGRRRSPVLTPLLLKGILNPWRTKPLGAWSKT